MCGDPPVAGPVLWVPNEVGASPSAGGSVTGSPRREQQARATRARIIAAAARRFLARGYAGTTMRAVAADAGVALPTVELVFGTKAKLLKAVVDAAIGGDDEPVPMLDREWARQAESVAGAGGFAGIGRAAAVDTVWALMDPVLFCRLTRDRHWSPARFRDFLPVPSSACCCPSPAGRPMPPANPRSFRDQHPAGTVGGPRRGVHRVGGGADIVAQLAIGDAAFWVARRPPTADAAHIDLLVRRRPSRPSNGYPARQIRGPGPSEILGPSSSIRASAASATGARYSSGISCGLVAVGTSVPETNAAGIGAPVTSAQVVVPMVLGLGVRSGV